MEGLAQQSRSAAETEVKSESFDILKQRFTAAIELPTSEERSGALEDLIAECAKPVQAGEALSPEYQAFLLNLTRMHMLEAAQSKLDRLLLTKN